MNRSTFYHIIPNSGILRRLKSNIRHILFRFVVRMMHDGTEPMPNVYTMKRILLVSVSQRLGNTILITPAVSALINAMPDAQITFVGGRHAKSVLEGYSIKQIHTIKRLETILPQRIWKLIKIIRKEKYDGAIHLSTSTKSLGAYITYASGTRHRIGCQRDDGNILFTSVFKHPRSRHKVDQIREYMQQIGIPDVCERRIILKPEEQYRAEEFFKRHFDDSFKKPIGIFVGGRERKGKGWDLRSIGIVVNKLKVLKIPVVIFLGPEEVRKERYIQSIIGPALYIKNVTLREVAALISRCKVILTPDSGPMHLAIAAGTKTVVLFSKPNYVRWGPKEPYGKVIFDKSKTSTNDILNALLEYYGYSE